MPRVAPPSLWMAPRTQSPTPAQSGGAQFIRLRSGRERMDPRRQRSAAGNVYARGGRRRPCRDREPQRGTSGTHRPEACASPLVAEFNGRSRSVLGGVASSTCSTNWIDLVSAKSGSSHERPRKISGIEAWSTAHATRDCCRVGPWSGSRDRSRSRCSGFQMRSPGR